MTPQNELDRNAMGGTELLGAALDQRLPVHLKNNFQIIRSRVRELEPNKYHILWLHDLALDPEASHLKDPASRARFDKLVFVSNWQQQQYHDALGVPFSAGIVIPNAVSHKALPIGQDLCSIRKDDDETIRLIYHSTPHRGLEILLPVFDALCEKHTNIHLDVYSSFKLYGWQERDAPYQELFDFCKAHPHITYHGTQDNQIIREALRKAHIFAYPSIWQETSCLCAIEAMSEGCMVVCPNLAALPETCGGLTEMYSFTEDAQQHSNRFYQKMDEVITQLRENSRFYLPKMELAADRVRVVNGWSRVQPMWQEMLTSLTRRGCKA